MSGKLMLRFWWNVKVSEFWTVVQPLLLVALRVLRLCSPRVTKMIHEFQMLIRVVVDDSTLEMVLHQRLHPCPDSQFEMMLLVTSDAGHGFSQGTALRHRLWQRLVSIPNSV